MTKFIVERFNHYSGSELPNLNVECDDVVSRNGFVWFSKHDTTSSPPIPKLVLVVPERDIRQIRKAAEGDES